MPTTITQVTAIFTYAWDRDPTRQHKQLTIPEEVFAGCDTQHDALEAVFTECNIGDTVRCPYSMSVGDKAHVVTYHRAGLTTWARWRCAPVGGWVCEEVGTGTGAHTLKEHAHA